MPSRSERRVARRSQHEEIAKTDLLPSRTMGGPCRELDLIGRRLKLGRSDFDDLVPECKSGLANRVSSQIRDQACNHPDVDRKSVGGAELDLHLMRRNLQCLRDDLTEDRMR